MSPSATTTTATTDPATTSRPTSAFRGHAKAGWYQPAATAILSTAQTTPTVRPAISTECTSVCSVRVVGSNQAITATMLLVSTVMAVPVTSTRRTSGDRARVLMGLNRPLATVTQLPVRTTRTPVLATSTRGTSVVPVRAMELDRTITATSLLAQVTRTVRNATST